MCGRHCARARRRPRCSPAAPWRRSVASWDSWRRLRRRDVHEIINTMVEVFRLELLGQLALATLLGGAIGLERELGGKPAGLRTNILICLGSVLYTKLSITMATGNADPTRVAAQIVTGVGFIGAGTILHASGMVVRLSRVDTIWC